MISFDNNPVVYWILCNTLLILTGLLTVLSFFKNRVTDKLNLTILLIPLYALLLLLLRLPIIVYNKAYNPDESLFLIGAKTLPDGLIPWIDFEGGSSGPFNYYILTLFCELTGQPYDYISTKIVEYLLLIGSLFFNFKALSKCFSKQIAFLCTFLVVAYIGSMRDQDLIHFSSEHQPMLLLGIMSYIYFKTNKEDYVNYKLIFIFGLIAGYIIFTKIQVIPIAFAMSIAFIWLIWNKTNQLFSKGLLLLVTGSILVPSFVALSALKLGILTKVWHYYFYNHLIYGKTELGKIIKSINLSFFDPANIFLKVIVVCSIFIVVFQLIYKKLWKISAKTIFLIAFTCSTISVVYKTGIVFQHYLLLLIFPSAYLIGYLLEILLNQFNGKYKLTIPLTSVLIAISTTVIYPFNNNYVTYGIKQRPLTISNTSKEIIKYSRTNERLVVWGDNGRLYLESDLHQGLLWTNTYWGMYPENVVDEYRDTYIQGFEKGKFPVFIDTHSVDTDFLPRAKFGYETSPKMKKIINDRYQYIGEYDSRNRIFVLKNRYLEVNK